MWLTGMISAFGEDKKCPESNSGLSLPNGFCATIFADKLGHARQLVVAPDGTVYINSWSGVMYGRDTPPPGGFLIALKDRKGTGHADVNERFGPSFAEGAHGGTGISLYGNWLYVEIDDKIVRYAIKTDELAPRSEPQTILSGMPITGDHAMRPFAIDAQGNLFVSIGSATNACEVRNRVPHSPGNNPCTELDVYGGIWRYDANKTNQLFSAKERYASGIRNGEGFDFDEAGRLFVTQHGRDQLRESWPELYTAEQGFELPAEEVVILKEGANYGWPTCYYDGVQEKRVLAPEYGGDGGTMVGHCDQFEPPVAVFPAHWAPNDLKIYKTSQFPSGYHGGAFIAFHGSWNRAPGPQGGYNVVFQPLSDGKISGNYIVFADGFAGKYKDPRRAAYRPSGLAIGPDGALYVTDDKVGRIWRVTYIGDPNVKDIQAALASAAKAKVSPGALPSDGIRPDAGAQSTGVLPVPPGATSDQVKLGKRIFHGEVVGAACAGCHGADGTGTPVGGDLTSGVWLWGDGSLESITNAIRRGVRRPKHHSGAMPPLGGVPLPESDLAALAAYVWAIGHEHAGAR